MKEVFKSMWIPVIIGAVSLLPPTNKIPTTVRAPRSVSQATNIVVSWGCYTDAWFAVSNSVDGVNWAWKTNVPINRTNWTFSARQPFELFKVATIVNYPSGQ